MHDLVVFNTFNFTFLLLMKLTLLNFEKKTKKLHVYEICSYHQHL